MALRFTIERWLDMPALGWYSGDGRAHALAPHAALLEAQAEDVHIVNLLAAVSASGGKKTLTNIVAFSGQAAALATPSHLVVVNTYNTHPVLGSLGLLNCHRPVYPLTFGEPENQDWTMAAWCDQCHRKNGLVVWARPGGAGDEFLGEPLIDLLLGKVDAFELGAGAVDGAVALWQDILDAGIRLPLIGSSGKDSNAAALGDVRTYAHLRPGDSFSYQAWIEAVRVGRTFVSNGPVLFFIANEREPGDVIRLPTAGESLSVRAEVMSLAPSRSLEVIMNGQVVATTDNALLDVNLPIAASGWLTVRCRGDNHFAQSSPIYVQVEGTPARRDAEALTKVQRQVARFEQWAGSSEPFLTLAQAARARCQFETTDGTDHLT